jgi:quercetin dioxygenase-like cupin family protein
MTEPALTVVRPGEGSSGELGSVGALVAVEHRFPVGALVAPHLHTREDEYSTVTGCRIGFRSEDTAVVLGAGGYVAKPRGELHAMWNAGDAPATMIEIISPAGLEGFFREVAGIVAAGPPFPPSAADLADRHGLGFERPPRLAEVVERCGPAVS